MNAKQFDEFWEIKCPKCNEVINVEILANTLSIRAPPAEKIKK